MLHISNLDLHSRMNYLFNELNLSNENINLCVYTKNKDNTLNNYYNVNLLFTNNKDVKLIKKFYKKDSRILHKHQINNNFNLNSSINLKGKIIIFFRIIDKNNFNYEFVSSKVIKADANNLIKVLDNEIILLNNDYREYEVSFNFERNDKINLAC